MPINPIQSALAGPSPSSSFSLQFGSNVTAGNLLVVKVWAVLRSDDSILLSDDYSNSYTVDVVNLVVGPITGYTSKVWIISAIANTGGVQPIVSLQFGPPPFGPSLVLLAGISVAEYPEAGSPRLDVTGIGSDDGSGNVNPSTNSVTTTANNEIAIALGVALNASLGVGSGWTSRDVWSQSSTCVALGEDKTIASSGTSVSGTMTGTSGSGEEWVIVMATYRVVSAVVYTDSIALGAKSGVVDQVVATLSPSALLGMLSLESASNVSALTQSSALAITMASLNILTYTGVGILPIGESVGIAGQVVWSATSTALMATAQLVACSVLVSVSGISVVGLFGGVLGQVGVDTSAIGALRALIGALTDTQRAFVDAISLGINQAFVTAVGRALVDALSMGGVIGTDVQLQLQRSGVSALGVQSGVSDQVVLTVQPVAQLVSQMLVASQPTEDLTQALGFLLGLSLISKLNVSTTGAISFNDIATLFGSLPGGTMPGLVEAFDQLVNTITKAKLSGNVVATDSIVWKGDTSDI